MKSKRVWIIDEGSQGHLVQSRGLVRELGKFVIIELHEIAARLHVDHRIARSIVKKLLHRGRMPWLFRRTHTLSPVPSEAPDLVVASGPRSLLALEFYAKLHRCPAVFVQGTVDVPRGTVDVIVKPDEGETRRDFLFIPLLFTEVTPQALLAAKQSYLTERGLEKDSPLKALFIGASSSKISFENSDWDRIAAFVNTSWERDRTRWLVTTSYRTGAEVEARLRGRIQPGAIFDAVWYSSSPRKITREFLGLADQAYVTIDSMTMISEAVAAGLPVFGICPAGFNCDPANTHHRYISSLAGNGHVTLLELLPPEARPAAKPSAGAVDYGPAIRDLLCRIGWEA